MHYVLRSLIYCFLYDLIYSHWQCLYFIGKTFVSLNLGFLLSK
ncbi:hypothetical protein A1OE_637 [Candidatus Endolissoclinum faulkneri L2]|uniref:Uncharacterized protein n=1 Tax=Candidatus Endolissoclinum faulkneri L2 TaxID=1193729 RepID=K7YGY8_9PROT|nr:hypothetical protein A1OE_637 [Candidatus Endolissoclinum faulkneri L2]